MTSNASLLGASVLLVVLLAAYGYITVRMYEDEQSKSANIANPAATHCINVGGTLEIRKDESGAESGYCALPDGRICEEWALFRDGSCVGSE